MARRAASALAIAVLLCAAPARGDGVPLSIRAVPAALEHGKLERATLHVEGSPAAPVLTASAGQVGPPRPEGDGRWIATLQAPREGYPQVVIVMASSGDRSAWTSVPIVGRGIATAHSAPGAAIRVTIGNVEFGPVRAGADGAARVPVTVPPGVTHAYHRGKPLELGIPPTLHVHAIAGRGEARAGEAADVPILVAAVHPDGTPRSGAPVAIETSSGTVGPLEEVAPGTYHATWHLPPGAAEPARATVRLSDEPGPSVALQVARPAGPPAHIAMSSDRARVAAGDEAPVAITARLVDAAGNPVEGTVSLEASFGTLSAVEQSGGGLVSALRVPPRLDGRTESVVTARAGALVARLALPLEPAPIEVELPPAAPERRLDVSTRFGLLRSAGGHAGASAAAGGTWWATAWDGRAGLSLELGTVAVSRTDEVTVGPGRLEVEGRARYVPVVASAVVRGRGGGRRAWWATAGAGLAQVSSRVAAGDQPGVVDSGWSTVLEASAAAGWRIGHALPFVEVRAARFADPGLDALSGALVGFGVAVGVRYEAY